MSLRRDWAWHARARPSLLVAAFAVGIAGCGREYATLPRAIALDVAPSAATLDVGGTQQLTASLKDANGNVIVSAVQLTWQSLNTTVATVSPSGLVTAVSAGSTEITASGRGLQGALALTVRIPPPARIDLEPPTATFARGDSLVITARARAPNGTPYAGRRFQWRSSNASVATLVAAADSASARVIALAPGSTTISAGNLGVEGSATLVVLPDPVIGFSETSVAFVGQSGSPDPALRTVQVVNGGGGTLKGLSISRVTYGAGEPAGWLQSSLDAPASGPASVRLQARLQGLPPGPYTATVVVASTQPAVQEQAVNVTLTVIPQAVLALAATSLSFGAAAGGALPSVQSIAISNGGGGALSGLAVTAPVSGGQAATWVTATLSGTTAPARVDVAVNQAGLAPGSYSATFTVSAANAQGSPRTVTVSLTVATNAVIQLSTSAVSLTWTIGSPPAATTANIVNGGGGALTGLSLSATTYGAGQSNGWLLAQLSAPQAPASISLSAPQVALTPGTYTASFEVRSTMPGVAPATVNVTLTVIAGGVINLSQSAVNMNAANGLNPSPANIAVTNGGGGQLRSLSVAVAYQALQPTGWLSATFAGGLTTAPTTLTLQASIGALNVGTYSASVTVASPDAAAPRVIPVTLVVQGAINASPLITVLGTQGLAMNTNVTDVVGSTTRPITGLAISVTYASPGANWLSASLSGTTTPSTLSLAVVAAANVPRGSDIATVRVSGNGVAPFDVAVVRRLVFTYDQHIVNPGAGRNYFGSCTGCHTGSLKPLTFSWAYLTSTFSTLNPALRYVNTGSSDPNQSFLHVKLNNLVGSNDHRGRLTQAQKDTVADWLRDGGRQVVP